MRILSLSIDLITSVVIVHKYYLVLVIQLVTGTSIGELAVSYTHLTLPTNREV